MPINAGITFCLLLKGWTLGFCGRWVWSYSPYTEASLREKLLATSASTGKCAPKSAQNSTPLVLTCPKLHRHVNLRPIFSLPVTRLKQSIRKSGRRFPIGQNGHGAQTSIWIRSKGKDSCSRRIRTPRKSHQDPFRLLLRGGCRALLA